MKILHMSDLHIGNLLSPPNESERADILADRIILKYEKSENEEKPVIVITGDIVDSGYKWQYKRAARIIGKLKGNGFTVVLVPGNHDYGPKGNFYSERFARYYRRYIEDVDYPNIAMQTENFTIVGLNSMEAETGLKDRYWADGQLGRNQLDLLARKLTETRESYGQNHKIVLTVHHHPFDLGEGQGDCDCHNNWWHCLKDGRDLMGLIAGSVDILLFGHEHVQHIWPPGAFEIPLICMSTKSTRRGQFKAIFISLEHGKPIAEEIIL